MKWLWIVATRELKDLRLGDGVAADLERLADRKILEIELDGHGGSRRFMQVGDAPQFAVGIARRGFDHGQSVEKGPSGTTRWWRG